MIRCHLTFLSSRLKWECKEIEGIKVRNHEIKLSVFADDLTTFVKNSHSFTRLKHLVNGFGNVSGLKLNEEKTEAYWLGSLHDSQEDLGIDKDKVNKPMKIWEFSSLTTGRSS